MDVFTEQKPAIGKEVRIVWRVKSLPWLILTDRKHIVRAQGLRLDELEIEIKKANK